MSSLACTDCDPSPPNRRRTARSRRAGRRTPARSRPPATRSPQRAGVSPCSTRDDRSGQRGSSDRRILRAQPTELLVSDVGGTGPVTWLFLSIDVCGSAVRRGACGRGRSACWSTGSCRGRSSGGGGWRGRAGVLGLAAPRRPSRHPASLQGQRGLGLRAFGRLRIVFVVHGGSIAAMPSLNLPRPGQRSPSVRALRARGAREATVRPRRNPRRRGATRPRRWADRLRRAAARTAPGRPPPARDRRPATRALLSAVQELVSALERPRWANTVVAARW